MGTRNRYFRFEKCVFLLIATIHHFKLIINLIESIEFYR
jgi:hypothetical protein